MDATDIAGLASLVIVWLVVLAWQLRRMFETHWLLGFLVISWGVGVGFWATTLIPDQQLPGVSRVILPVGTGPIPIFAVVWAARVLQLEGRYSRTIGFFNAFVANTSSKKDVTAADAQIQLLLDGNVITATDGASLRRNARVPSAF